MKIKASEIRTGNQYKDGSTIQEVTKIIRITNKTIEFRTKRIAPDQYDGDFYARKNLNTIINIIN